MIGPRLGTTAFDKQQLLVESDGLLARAYANVFQAIDARKSEMHVTVRASCCEVYHEQVLIEHTHNSSGHALGACDDSLCLPLEAHLLQVSW